MTFNATVQPFFFVNERELAAMPRPVLQGRQKMLLQLIKEMKVAVKQETGDEFLGHERTGECVSHFMLDTDSLLDSVKEYAADLEKNDVELVYKDENQTRFNQLIGVPATPSILIPQYFFYPVWVRLKGLRNPVFVGSLPRLQDELKILNKVLNIFIPDAMPAFLEASEEDLEDYPFGRGDELWVNLGFIFMSRLADYGMEHELPLMINLDQMR